MKIGELLRNFLNGYITLDNYSETSYLNIYHEYVKNFVESLNSNPLIVKERIRPLKIHILTDNSVNAKTRIEDQYDIIEINIGTITEIHNVFFHLCEHPEFFPNIGDCKDCKITALIKPHIKSSRIVFYNGVHDKKRQELAFALSFLAITFILNHEVGHHFNGHVLFDSKHSFSAFGEQSIIVPNQNDCLISQVLEMNADGFACTSAMQQLLSESSLILGAKNHKELLDLWFHAISVLFLSLETCQRAELSAGLYLPNFYRLVFCANTSIDVLKKLMPFFDKEIYNQQFISVLNNCIAIYKQIKPIDFLNLIIRDLQADDYYNDVILSEWTNIRPTLSQYARVPLPE